MQSGQVLGERYRLDEQVASGGMGSVWRGLDTRLRRPVAVKVLHSRLAADRVFRQRFAVEARAVAALHTPAIVRIYDYHEESMVIGKAIYLVMEYVDGRPLQQLLLERGRLDPHETMNLIGEAAEALDVAHTGGIIHRDIKPANILITHDTWRPKIVDFGIARAGGRSGLTSTGMVMGTAGYVSPELLRGEDPTGSSDVYSLGVVAYECLAGHPLVAPGPPAKVAEQLDRQPPPLPDDIPGEISRVVMRALAKDPEQRWPDAAAFARACRSPDEATAPKTPAATPHRSPGSHVAGHAAQESPYLRIGMWVVTAMLLLTAVVTLAVR